MRIAVWAHMLGQGGAERVLGQLASSFAESGHTVDIYVHEENNPYASELHEHVRLHVLNNGVARLVRPRILTYALIMTQVLRESGAQVLLTTGYVMNAGGVLASWLSGTDSHVFIREANTFSAQTKQARSWVQVWTWRLARLLYPAADGIIAPSQGVTEDLFRSFPQCSDRIHTIANPLPHEDIQRRAAEPLPRGAPADQTFILGVGRLVPQKDFATLIRAWAKVTARQDIDLVILGKGLLETELRGVANGLGLGHRLHLPGFDSNPFRYMKRCACYVLSSRYEGLPNTLLQAMAVGAPVVATDCPSGPREILHGGKLGPLVPVGDVDEMSNQIERALLGQFDPRVGMEEVRTRYAAQTIAAEYMELFDREIRRS